MPFADRDVLCADCGVTFVFSAGEQEFFQGKGFSHVPKRCKQCKAKREGGNGRRRIETHVNCSECGSGTDCPIQADAGQASAVRDMLQP